MVTKLTPQFTAWISALKDVTGRTRVLARVRRLGEGNPGDHRKLTGGISEMRIDVGPGYRVYYTERGEELIILLVGGDKGSQQRDIKRAKEMARSL